MCFDDEIDVSGIEKGMEGHVVCCCLPVLEKFTYRMKTSNISGLIFTMSCNDIEQGVESERRLENQFLIAT